MSDARKILMSMMLLGQMVRGEYFEQEQEDAESESEEEDGECSATCSECEMGVDVLYNFCPRCGAKMENRTE